MAGMRSSSLCRVHHPCRYLCLAVRSPKSWRDGDCSGEEEELIALALYGMPYFRVVVEGWSTSFWKLGSKSIAFAHAAIQ